MKCPQCGSENIHPSHRRGTEKILKYIMPRSPYRCRECWGRFWVSSNPFKSLLSKIILGLILLLIVVPIIAWIIGKPSEPEPIIPQKPTIAKPSPKMEVPIAMNLPVKETIPSSAKDPASEKSEIKEPVSDSQDEKSKLIAELKKENFLEKKIDAIPEISEKATLPVTIPFVEPEKRVEPEKHEPVSSDKIEQIAEPEKRPNEKKSNVISETTQKKSDLKSIMKDLKPYSTDSEFTAEIFFNRQVEHYVYDYMKSPPRLVLNIWGNWKNGVKNEIPVAGTIVNRIRIGEHPGTKPFISIVFDLTEDKALTETVNKIENGLRIHLKPK